MHVVDRLATQGRFGGDPFDHHGMWRVKVSIRLSVLRSCLSSLWMANKITVWSSVLLQPTSPTSNLSCASSRSSFDCALATEHNSKTATRIKIRMLDKVSGRRGRSQLSQKIVGFLRKFA